MSSLYSSIFVNPTYIAIRQEYEHSKSGKFDLSTVSNEATGILSTNAERKMKLAINQLYQIADRKRVYQREKQSYFYYKVGFITLTLSSKQKHTDQFITTNLLKRFIESLKYNYRLNNFVWKAERQQNGNIHYHILTDSFIHYRKIREIWNRQQLKHGYISSPEYVGEVNSTDVKCVVNEKLFAKYMVKYMLKGKQKLPKYQPINDILCNTCEVCMLVAVPLNLEIETRRLTRPVKLKVIYPLAAYVEPIGGRLWSSSQNLTKKFGVVEDHELGGKIRGLRCVKSDNLLEVHTQSLLNYKSYPEPLKTLYADHLKEVKEEGMSKRVTVKPLTLEL